MKNTIIHFYLEDLHRCVCPKWFTKFTDLCGFKKMNVYLKLITALTYNTQYTYYVLLCWVMMNKYICL